MGFYCERIKDIKYLFKEVYKVGKYMDNQIMCNKFINQYIFRGENLLITLVLGTDIMMQK